MSGDSRRPETSDFHIVEIVIDADGGEAEKDGMIKKCNSSFEIRHAHKSWGKQTNRQLE